VNVNGNDDDDDASSTYTVKNLGFTDDEILLLKDLDSNQTKKVLTLYYERNFKPMPVKVNKVGRKRKTRACDIKGIIKENIGTRQRNKESALKTRNRKNETIIELQNKIREKDDLIIYLNTEIESLKSQINKIESS
jgi:hypothetical protein